MPAILKTLLALTAVLALASCGGDAGGPAPPAPEPIGSGVTARDFRVNSSTVGRQTLGRGAVAQLADGGHVVVWTSRLAEGSSVRLQRFDANGLPRGLETLVASRGESAAVAPLADGGFVVTWNGTPGSGGPGLLQRYSALGAPLGVPLRFNLLDGLFFFESRPVLLADGRLLLVWTFTTADRTGTPQAAMRLFNPDGTAASPEFALLPQLASLDAAALPDGGFVIAWAASEQVGTRAASVVRTRVFNADASLRRAEVTVPVVAGGEARDPAVAGLADGRFALAWEQVLDSDTSRVEAQVLPASGAAPTEAPRVIGTPGGAFPRPALTGLPGGGFAVAWQQVHERDQNYRRTTQLQRFDASGAPRGTPVPIGSAEVTGTVGPDADLRLNDRLALAPSAAEGLLLLRQHPDADAPRDWDVLGTLR